MGRKMGKSQRDKGRRGAREALSILADRDWQTVETRDGQGTDDAVVISPAGTAYSLEIKNHKTLNLAKFLQQARGQAAKRKMPWLLMCRLDGGWGWLVLSKGDHARIWRVKEELC